MRTIRNLMINVTTGKPCLHIVVDLGWRRSIRAKIPILGAKKMKLLTQRRMTVEIK
jgi:hypothetical protein